tara:strand:+ start:1183 stop:2862 length:1680 start_codon:yes stop_codon:yes gene_type:complete
MAEKVVIDIDVKSKDAEKQVDNLNKELSNTNENLDNITDAGDKMTGGLISGFKSVVNGVKGAIKSLFTLKGALLATGIGAFVLAIGAIQTALTNSEAGQNRFTKWLNQTSVIIGNVTDILGNFGNAIMSFVTLNFDEAADSIAKVTEGIKNFGEETRKEIAIAGELSDMRAKADKAERELQVERAKSDRRRAELLEQSINKEKFTVQERIGFLQEAARVEEDITNKEIEAAKLRLEARKLENSLSESTKEDLEDEARLEAELIQLETAKLTKQKEVTSQIIAFKAEEAAAKKAIDDKLKADEDEAQRIIDDKKKEDDDKKKQAEIDLFNLKLKIRDAEAVTEDERRALEIQKTIEHYDQLIRLAKEQGLATEQLEKAKNNALDKYNKENANNEIKWSEMTSKEKVDIANSTLGNMATILGEESAAGKAAAIGQATISTFQSATDSYKSMAGIPIVGPALGAIAAAAAIKSGMAQVKAITSTKLPTLAGKSAPSVGSSSPSTPTISTPPQFNVVGSSGADQLADAIAGNQQQPVKAFVVSNDVTTAQELDRNIVDGATIG